MLAGRTGTGVSGRQHQSLGFRVLPPEQPVIRCPPAGEQEQRHVDAKGLLKQRHNTSDVIQTADLNGALQAWAGLIDKGSKQPVEALLQQGLGWRHAPNLFKADMQAVLADAKSLGNLRGFTLNEAMKEAAERPKATP